jgi:hypothetical protein
VHPGIVPGLVVTDDVPAVRHAPLKKYQLLVVVPPVKSSLKVICARLSDAASEQSSIANATHPCLMFVI